MLRVGGIRAVEAKFTGMAWREADPRAGEAQPLF